MYRKLIFISVCVCIDCRSWSIDLINADRRFHISHSTAKRVVDFIEFTVANQFNRTNNENQVKTNFA